MKNIYLFEICIFLWIVNCSFSVHAMSIENPIENQVSEFATEVADEGEVYTSAPNILCFYTNSHDFRPNQIITSYCTHILTFANFDGYDMTVNAEDLADFVALKAIDPGFKFMVSLAGVGANSTLSHIVNSPELYENFTRQSLQFMHDNQIDGIDFDWEFPSAGGDPPSSKQALPHFLQYYLEAATEFSNSVGRPRAIITLDVSALLVYMDFSYNITEIAKYADFVNVMCYDFHYYEWYDFVTDSNSPLYNRTQEPFVFDTLNLDWTVKEWHSRGMPKEKMNVGIPSYGHSYTLRDPQQHGLDAPASGPGLNGGALNYRMVCEFVKGGASVVFDEESQVPYTYKDLDWISFDDIRSTTAKTKYILDNGYAGIMVWSTNNDDYLAECDGITRFPIIGTVYNISRTYLAQP